MDNNELDRFIRQALDRSEREVPREFRARLLQRTSLIRRNRSSHWRRILPWLPLLAAAALVIAFSLPVFHPPRPTETKITQIRTEFSIPEKNIRIVWVQRDDFRLGHGDG